MSFILMAEVMRIDIKDPLAKWLLLCLSDYADEKTQTCFPSVTTIIKRSGMKKTSVHSKLNWLEEHEYIGRLSGNSYTSNVYTVLPNLVRQTNYVVHEANPNLPSNKVNNKKRLKKKSKLSDEWTPSTKLLERIEIKFGSIKHDDETDRFINYHLAKGTVFADPERAYWNWCRNSTEWKSNITSFEKFKANKATDRNGHSDGYFAGLSDQFQSED